MRLLTHLLIASLLSVIETSFFGSVHGIIRFTPFVLVMSVYLLQHHAMQSTASWMIIHGVILDLSGLSHVPLITIAYMFTAWVAVMSAERLFSNRSFYGVIACAGLSYLTFEISTGILGFIRSLIFKQPFHGGTFFSDAGARFMMLALFLVLLFSFAKQIRYALVKLSLISPARQTY